MLIIKDDIDVDDDDGCNVDDKDDIYVNDDDGCNIDD